MLCYVMLCICRPEGRVASGGYCGLMAAGLTERYTDTGRCPTILSYVSVLTEHMCMHVLYDDMTAVYLRRM